MREPVAVFAISYPRGQKAKAIFCKRYGLNAYYAGKHWAERKRDAETLHLMAKTAMTRAGIPHRCLSFPAAVRFYWDDGLDIDNHAVLGKAILDAMRSYGLLKDDSRRYVGSVSHEFWGGGEILVEVGRYEKAKPGGAAENLPVLPVV